jgi:methylated-DNA-[protein]-cysteine S-methyltransferase
MPHLAHTIMESPVGLLTFVAVDGALTGLYMDRQQYRPETETFGERDDTLFTQALEEVEEYFAGRRTDFEVPLGFVGTPFQRLVWEALRKIPFGQTVSYGQLADRLGRPTAARAVGMANGHNPIGIIVPCHRVVSAKGELVGYGGGLERKRHLLDFERGVLRRGAGQNSEGVSIQSSSVS